jgi:Na+-transporting methylmalonyl-CoA/oxaloacetate decarboxylase gamma subunit
VARASRPHQLFLILVLWIGIVLVLLLVLVLRFVFRRVLRVSKQEFDQENEKEKEQENEPGPEKEKENENEKENDSGVAQASRPPTARSAASMPPRLPPASCYSTPGAGETPAPRRSGAAPLMGWKPMPLRSGEATFAGETPAPLGSDLAASPSLGDCQIVSKSLVPRLCFLHIQSSRCAPRAGIETFAFIRVHSRLVRLSGKMEFFKVSLL